MPSKDVAKASKWFLPIWEVYGNGKKYGGVAGGGMGGILIVNSNPVIVNRTTRFSCTKARTYHSLGRRKVRIVLIGDGPSAVVASISVTSHICVRPVALPFIARIVGGRNPSTLLTALNKRINLGVTISLSRTNILRGCNIRLLNSSLRTVGRTRSHRLFGHTVGRVRRPIPRDNVFSRLRPTMAFTSGVNCPIVVHPTCALKNANNNVTRSHCRVRRVSGHNVGLSPVGRVLMRHDITN